MINGRKHTHTHTPSVKFTGVTIYSHLNMKSQVDYLERTCLIGRMNITRLNLTSDTLLIRLYKIVIGPYMDYACTALTTLNQTQRH